MALPTVWLNQSAWRDSPKSYVSMMPGEKELGICLTAVTFFVMRWGLDVPSAANSVFARAKDIMSVLSARTPPLRERSSKWLAGANNKSFARRLVANTTVGGSMW